MNDQQSTFVLEVSQGLPARIYCFLTLTCFHIEIRAALRTQAAAIFAQSTRVGTLKAICSLTNSSRFIASCS